MVTEAVHLYVARHAQARSADGSYDHDTPLSPLGRRQAEAIAAGLANAGLAAIYASSSRRALETAEPLARVTGLAVRVEERLLEFEIGGWNPEGGADQIDWAIWRPDHRGVPDGETLQAFAERIAAACETIARAHTGESVAIVAHSGTNDAILRWAMSIPAGSGWSHEFDLPNAAIVELLVWPRGRHPEGAPRYAALVRAPDLDHLPESLRSDR